MAMTDYILVTPCKNEEESLHKVMESVINQTVKPNLWVIVDDGSTDKTPSILKEITAKHNWIRTIRLNETPRDLGIHVAQVYRKGFDEAIQYCVENNIEYRYIGVVDSDIILDSNYFEALIYKFKNNPKLGVCSGHIGNIVNGKIVWSDYRDDLPSGGARLWTKKCFEETDRYLLTCSPDSVSNVKAKIKGWETKQYGDICAVSTRPYASAEGQWTGYKKLGSNNYFIGYTPLHIILKGISLFYSKKGYFKTGIGFAYMYGYFRDYFKNRPRLDDEEVKEYYAKRLVGLLCSKLKFQRKAN